MHGYLVLVEDHYRVDTDNVSFPIQPLIQVSGISTSLRQAQVD